MKKEKFIIIGASGSGKDYLLKGLVDMGECYIPKLTTRPARKNEINGVDYIFINNDEFLKLKSENKIKVCQKFTIEDNDWWYGITNENFYENNLFIMTPDELNQLSAEDRKMAFVVYLDINENVRRERIKKRYDNNDSIDRRIESDKIDFLNFSNYDMRVIDPEFYIKDIWEFAF